MTKTQEESLLLLPHSVRPCHSVVGSNATSSIVPVAVSLTSLTESLSDLLLVLDDMPKQLVNDPRSSMAKWFGLMMQSSGQHIIASHTVITQCLQSIDNVCVFDPSHGSNPSHVQNNESHGERWSLLHECSVAMHDALGSVAECSTEWYTFLSKLDRNLSTSQQRLTNSTTDIHALFASFCGSAKLLRSAHMRNSDTLQQIRVRTHQIMNKVMCTFVGHQTFASSQSSLHECQALLSQQQDSLHQTAAHSNQELCSLLSTMDALKVDLETCHLKQQESARTLAEAESKQSHAQQQWWKSKVDMQTLTKNGQDDEKTNATMHAYWHELKQQRTQELEVEQQTVTELATTERDLNQSIASLEEALSAQMRSLEESMTQHMQCMEEVVTEVSLNSNIVDSMVRKYGVHESCLSEFLKGTRAVASSCVELLQATKVMDVNACELTRSMTWQCESELTVDTYLNRVGLDSLVAPLRDAEYVYMNQLECGDEAEFEQRFDALLKTCGANRVERRKLKRLCCKRKAIKEWKRVEQEMKHTHAAMFRRQLPVLSVFVPALRRRFTAANRLLVTLNAYEGGGAARDMVTIEDSVDCVRRSDQERIQRDIEAWAMCRCDAIESKDNDEHEKKVSRNVQGKKVAGNKSRVHLKYAGFASSLAAVGVVSWIFT